MRLLSYVVLSGQFGAGNILEKKHVDFQLKENCKKNANETTFSFFLGTHLVTVFMVILLIFSKQSTC